MPYPYIHRFLLLLILLQPLVSNAQGQWDPRFYAPYPTGIESLRMGPDDVLYATGDFDQLDGRPMGGIARFDGTWQSLSTNAVGYAISQFLPRENEIYVGGGVQNIDGVLVNHIAQWDGTAWNSLDGGVDLYVNAFTVRGDEVFASTCQHTRDGTYGDGWYYDGNAWTKLSNLPKCAGAMFTGSDGSIYVASGDAIHRWNVQTNDLEQITTEFPGFNELILDANDAFWGVHLTWTDDGELQQRIARWDGTAWVFVSPSNHLDYVHLTTGADENLYVVERDSLSSHILRWDTDRFTPVGPALLHEADGGVISIAVSTDGTVHATGTFRTADAGARNLARLHGGTWQPLYQAGLGSDTVLSDVVRGPDGDVYVSTEWWRQSGGAMQVGTLHTPGAARWDGDQWHALDTSFLATQIRFDRQGTRWASGSSDYDDRGWPLPALARWEDNKWHPEPSLHCFADPSLDTTAPYTFAFDHTNQLYAAGACRESGAVIGFVATLDGSTWRLVGRFEADQGKSTRIYALAFDDQDHLYAGGIYLRVNGTPARSLARWDGAQWHAVGGTGLHWPYEYTGYALDIVWHDGSLYVGGVFDHAGDVPAASIARWDGSQWHALDGGLNDAAVDLHMDDRGMLYVAGTFQWAGTTEAAHLARWDGSQWESLGDELPGLYDRPHAITTDAEGAVYFVGDFSQAGPYAAAHIARWSPEATSLPPEETIPDKETPLLTVAPNPMAGSGTLAVTLRDEAQDVSIRVYDTLGREQVRVFDGTLQADRTIRFTLNLTRSGVYYVRLVSDKVQQTRSIVVVR